MSQVVDRVNSKVQIPNGGSRPTNSLRQRFQGYVRCLLKFPKCCGWDTYATEDFSDSAKGLSCEKEKVLRMGSTDKKKGFNCNCTISMEEQLTISVKKS